MPLEALRAAVRPGRAGAALLVAVRRCRSTGCCGSRMRSAAALGRGRVAAVDARLGLRADDRRRPLDLPVDDAAPALGLVPFAIGAIGAALQPRRPTCWSLATAGISRSWMRDGTPLILRDRAGDYVAQLFAEPRATTAIPRDLGSRVQRLLTATLASRFSARVGRMAAARHAFGDADRLVGLDRACADRRHRRIRPPSAARDAIRDG